MFGIFSWEGLTLNPDLPADYMVPELIIPMAHLPALPNGKVNRKGLPAPDFTHVARRKYVGPHNLNEEHIQDIWHEVRLEPPHPRSPWSRLLFLLLQQPGCGNPFPAQ